MKNDIIKNEEISLRINLGTRPVFGHGKAKLLEAISLHGSISAAARKIGMSYRRAWLLTNAMNQDFKLPLMESSLGGKGGGGAELTDEGRKVLKLFRDMELKAQKSLIKEKIMFSKLIS
jgi:molybdate transport system regulatory protein